MNREKKQLVVVGVLVVLILAVGGFQFMRGSDAPPPAAAKKEEKKATDAKTEVPVKKNPELTDMAPKDPFTPAGFIAEGTTPTTNPVPPVQQKMPSNKDILRNHGGSSDRISGGFLENPWVPGGEGTIGKTKEVKPVEPPKPEFGYNLVGIVEGAHPMAVFEDASGNQQLVEVGQGIGPSSTVTHISRGTVRVKFNAETLTFSVGGNPHAK